MVGAEGFRLNFMNVSRKPQLSTVDGAVGKVVLSAWEVFTVLTRRGITGEVSGTKVLTSHLWTL